MALSGVELTVVEHMPEHLYDRKGIDSECQQPLFESQ